MATHTSVCAALHCSSRQGKRPAPELRQSPAAGTVQALTQHWPHWLYSTLETDVACADGTAQPVSCQASLSWLSGARGEASVASVGCSAPPCDPEIERRAAAGATQAKRAEPVSLALSTAIDCDSAGPKLEAKNNLFSQKKKYISALGCRTTAALLCMDAVVRPAVPTHLSSLARMRLFRKKARREAGGRERALERSGRSDWKPTLSHALARSQLHPRDLGRPLHPHRRGCCSSKPPHPARRCRSCSSARYTTRAFSNKAGFCCRPPPTSAQPSLHRCVCRARPSPSLESVLAHNDELILNSPSAFALCGCPTGLPPTSHPASRIPHTAARLQLRPHQSSKPRHSTS